MIQLEEFVQRAGRRCGPRGPGEWLLMKEIGPVADAADVFEAGEQVCQKLSLRLSRRVSTDGAQAILSRTLHLARAESPFLRMSGLDACPKFASRE